MSSSPNSVRAQDGVVPHRTWSLLDGLPVRAVVTSRAGGVSAGPYESLNLGLHVGDDPDAVLENRRRAASAVGLGLDDLVFGNQAHGREIAVVGPEHRGRGARSLDDVLGDVDALVTTEPGIGLVVMVADCVPLVLYAPDVHAVAVVHAGWRGTVAQVATVAVDVLRGLGASPAEVRAGIGPAIPAERYEVGPEVAAAVGESFGAAADAVVVTDGDGRWRFDLWAANRRLLLDAGLREANIELDASPTGTGTPFFSDRAVRPCGRFAVVACLEPRP